MLHGVQKDIVYVLRVMATSLGGDGTKSPATLFTLGGCSSLHVLRPGSCQLFYFIPSARTPAGSYGARVLSKSYRSAVV